MPALRQYNLFISHAWDYNDEYYKLVNHLEKAPLFKFSNYSVPEHNPLNTKTATQLEKALYNQIKPTSVVLILAGMYVNYRNWILKEIEIANDLDKPIIAIKPWGSQKIPSVLADNAHDIVGWNTQSIVNSIRENSL